MPISNINTFFSILLCGTSKYQITAMDVFKKSMPKKIFKPFLAKTFGFLVFSGNIKWEHRPEMSQETFISLTT